MGIPPGAWGGSLEKRRFRTDVTDPTRWSDPATDPMPTFVLMEVLDEVDNVLS